MLSLRDIERFEQCQVAVEVRWTVDVGQLPPTLSTNRRYREAGRVEVLVGSEMSGRVANDRRLQVRIVGPQVVFRVDGVGVVDLRTDRRSRGAALLFFGVVLRTISTKTKIRAGQGG